MPFEEKLKIAYEYLDKHCFIEKEDIKQDVALYLWQNPTDNIIEVCEKVKRVRLKDEFKHQAQRAESIYGDDGECLDDNYYFVDERTIEYNEQKSLVTDDDRKKVAEMEKTLQFIDAIYGSKQAGIILRPNKPTAKVREYRGRLQAQKYAKADNYMQKRGTRWIFKTLISDCMNNWSGLATMRSKRTYFKKKLKDQKLWLC
jgi:hypothetical protein